MTDQKHQRLVELVRKMRGYQINYFKYRASIDLKLSKQYEREVDKLLAQEMQVQKSKQQEIF